MHRSVVLASGLSSFFHCIFSAQPWEHAAVRFRGQPLLTTDRIALSQN